MPDSGHSDRFVPIDHRSVRTRAMLQRALMSLILKKRYESITVKDVCGAARVGRSTFYAHYTSKDDLKRGGLEHLRTRLAARRERGLSFSLAMFEHAREHLEHYRALAGGHGGGVALAGIRSILCDVVRDELAATPRNGGAAIPRELVVQHVVGAYMAVLTWWLEGGAKLPPREVDAMFRRLTKLPGCDPVSTGTNRAACYPARGQ